MKRTSIYTFLLLILLAFEATDSLAQQQTIQRQTIRGPRLGIDVSGLIWQYVQPDHLSVSVYGDYEIMPAIFSVAEIGRLQVKRNETTFDYSSKGYFGKIGADYNFLHNKLDPVAQYDMIYGGLRIGAARYHHQASNIIIQSDYWGNYPGGDLSSKTMHAYWVELVAGIRVEALKNFFLGWSIRGQIMVSRNKDQRLDTWMIPGFGKAESNTGLSFTYTFSYRIPLARVPAQPPTFF